MDPILFIKTLTIPEKVEIVDKTKVVHPAGGLQPSVKAEESAKMASSTTQSRDRARYKNTLSRVFQNSKKKIEVTFNALRLLTSCIIRSHMNNGPSDRCRE